MYLAIHYASFHMHCLYLFTYDVSGNSLRFISHVSFHMYRIYLYTYKSLVMMNLAIHYASFHTSKKVKHIAFWQILQ
jgi:hypothetical protein